MFTRYGGLVWVVNAMVAVMLSFNAASAAEPVRILALGDSLTAGYGLAREDGFPARLESALQDAGYAVAVADGGVSGDTSAGGLARLDWALASVPDGGPDAVIVALGANDGLRGIDPAAMEANLDAILGRLSERDLPVVLAGMLAPPNLGREYGDAFNAVFPRLAERHKAILHPFLLEGVAARPHLNQADGIHPNEAGVDVMVRNIMPVAQRLVERVHRRTAETPNDQHRNP